MDKVTKRIKPKWQLEKEQSKRGTFDSLNDFANSLQETFKNMSKAFHWGYNKKKSRSAIEKTRRVRKKNKGALVN